MNLRQVVGFRSFGSVFMVLMAVVAVVASSAGADALGQQEAWGEFGIGPGELFDPEAMGVDPVDGSVYIGDVYGFTGLRMQKFS